MKRRKDGRYQQELPTDLTGGKRKVVYGKTKAEVLRKVSRLKEETGQNTTFQTAADEWWEEAEPKLAVTTRRGYRPAKARAIEQFGQRKLKDIRPSDISNFLSRITKANSMAEKTAKTQLLVVSLIFQFAVKRGYIDVNPAREIKVNKGLEKTRREAASSEDIKRIKESYSLPFGDFALWALYTGCRRGELLALTWEDVDLDNREIRINKSLFRAESGKMELKRPKTEAGERVVPIPDKLAEHINKGKGPVFNSGGKYLTDRQAMKRWEKYQKLSGVKCTPHQLRHAYATMLFEADVSESDAQELLGHAQISTTKDIYTHIREQRKKKIREQLRTIDIQ